MEKFRLLILKLYLNMVANFYSTTLSLCLITTLINGTIKYGINNGFWALQEELMFSLNERNSELVIVSDNACSRNFTNSGIQNEKQFTSENLWYSNFGLDICKSNIQFDIWDKVFKLWKREIDKEKNLCIIWKINWDMVCDNDNWDEWKLNI